MLLAVIIFYTAQSFADLNFRIVAEIESYGAFIAMMGNGTSD